ncbi:hypothetical protein B0O99DRAFT_644070 [Bisporella sp. PMI_857]|nr:hypothetical protein B0O99DRAFT_644070 [Bisporella sp. PMI_857]
MAVSSLGGGARYLHAMQNSNHAEGNGIRAGDLSVSSAGRASGIPLETNDSTARRNKLGRAGHRLRNAVTRLWINAQSPSTSPTSSRDT